MSKNKKNPEGQIDRRGFLKGIAATGAMATITAAHTETAAQSASENKSAAKSWRDRPDPIDESLISEVGTYDIVVVGGGNSGMYCASAAANKGASVAVIEAQAEKGYVAGAGKEVATVNSQYALDHGAPRIEVDDFLREWARRNAICHDPRRASCYVKNSGRIFDWVISFVDKKWLDENCHMFSCPPLPECLSEVSGWRFYHGTAVFLNKNNNTGLETWPVVARAHKKKAEELGAKWFFEHHAEICDVDGSGAVTGVVAKRADGRYVRFKARKGVALCAEGFAQNSEMAIDILDTYRHELEARGGNINAGASGGQGGAQSGRGVGSALSASGVKIGIIRDGSGIKMGIWAGGHLEIGPRASASGEPGGGVWFLQLNKNGERFFDEAAGSAMRQPSDNFTVTIHDANWKKVIAMRPTHHGSVDTADMTSWPPTLAQLDNVKPGPGKNSWGKDRFLRFTIQGDLYCANTIEELLGYMDCWKGETRKKALAEIQRYNEMCRKGVDEDFGKDRRIMKATELKDPPFYGTVNKGGGIGMGAGGYTFVGLDTDAEGHVLNSEFKPIKGLYAAGNNAGNRFIIRYQTPMAGMSIGMAMTEGCLLGERLAAL
ncbi:MAG: FAD-binding protein [Deltaproteobacteria bacterium]|nr:FAD-binding protein [Deltaproteobacteria bacterium]